jgi:AraC-like DNA-binding protein
MRYWRNHTNAFTLQLLDDGVSEHIIYRYEFDSAALPSRQQVEYCFGAATRLSRVVGSAPDENPVLVRFKHARPADTSFHDKLFRCPLEFDAPHDEFVLERRLLDFPIHGSLKNFKWLLDRYIRNRIRRVAVYDQSMTAMVSSAVRSILGSRVCSSEFVASSLGMNSKKMQRLLAQEGTSFSQILDETRRAAAIEMLLESDAPVSRIAGLLDYSTVAPFTTAFTRWTGVSPRTYRNQVKSGDPESLES